MLLSHLASLLRVPETTQKRVGLENRENKPTVFRVTHFFETCSFMYLRSPIGATHEQLCTSMGVANEGLSKSEWNRVKHRSQHCLSSFSMFGVGENHGFLWADQMSTATTIVVHGSGNGAVFEWW